MRNQLPLANAHFCPSSVSRVHTKGFLRCQRPGLIGGSGSDLFLTAHARTKALSRIFHVRFNCARSHKTYIPLCLHQKLDFCWCTVAVFRVMRILRHAKDIRHPGSQLPFVRQARSSNRICNGVLMQGSSGML